MLIGVNSVVCPKATPKFLCVATPTTFREKRRSVKYYNPPSRVDLAFASSAFITKINFEAVHKHELPYLWIATILS